VYYGAGGAFRIIGGGNAGLYFRHSDHLGSTSVLSDADGLRVEGSEVVYAPFGEVRIGEQTELTDFGFTGQRLDESTGGLMYYGARYYLPSLRRFISADTIVPGAGNPQNLNRYSYVLNNPVNLIDPTGHRPPTEEEEQWWGMEGHHTGGGGDGGGSSGSSGSSGSVNLWAPANSGVTSDEAVRRSTGGNRSGNAAYYQGNLNEQELAGNWIQQRGPNDCGPTGVTIGLHMLDIDVDYDDVLRASNSWTSLLLLVATGHLFFPDTTFRVAPGWATMPYQQANLAMAFGGEDVAAVSFQGTRDSLLSALQMDDTVILLTVGWGSDEVFTRTYNQETYRTGLGEAAHVVVLAAYDSTHPDGPWGIIDPDIGGTDYLTWVDDPEQSQVWGHSIPVIGSNNMVLISRRP
jgi:RHS repeat-associated protein